MILPRDEESTHVTVAMGISLTEWSASPVASADSNYCSMIRTSQPLIPPLAPPSMREPC
jgi:hypothetical protein